MIQGRIELRRWKNVSYFTVPALDRMGFRTAFFQRRGGLSQTPYQGLNLGLNTRDDPQAVANNRHLAIQGGDFGPLLPVVGQQAHGTRLRIVGPKDAGRGWLDFASGPAATDGLLTRQAGLPLAVSVADCLPVLFASPQGHAAAAVHAGWRGIAGNILARTVQRFKRQWNIQAEDLWAIIGPGIGPTAFIIQGEVLQRLAALYPQAVTRRAHDTAGFDLWQAARLQLLGQGVESRQIIAICDCTYSHPRKYFSYRRDHETGRMLGMIQIK